MVQTGEVSQSLYRIWSVGLRVIRQTKRDRRTIVALIINPIILMLLIGYAFSGTFTGINLGIVELYSGPVQESVVNHLQASDTFSITYLASESEARKLISEGRIDGAVVLGNNAISLILDGTSPQVAGTITTVVQTGLQAAAAQILGSMPVRSGLPTVNTLLCLRIRPRGKRLCGARPAGRYHLLLHILEYNNWFPQGEASGYLREGSGIAPGQD